MTTLRVAPSTVGADRITVESENAFTSPQAGFVMASNRIDIRISVTTFTTPPVMVYGERSRLRVSDLGWSREEPAAVLAQLAVFEEDWDAPGMDAYDAL